MSRLHSKPMAPTQRQRLPISSPKAPTTPRRVRLPSKVSPISTATPRVKLNSRNTSKKAPPPLAAVT
ncbi:hypothetical protein D3C77_164410 [compost metagenome]